MTSVLRNLSLVTLFGFGLIACGEGDSGTASAPAPAAAASAPAAAAPAPAAEPAAEDSSIGFDINSIEKAEGVIYQDEIYANWPYN